jgi:hypothetical protein
VVDKLPYNHYGRKMIGYLFAVGAGADMIIDTDDDNIPKAGWTFPSFDGSYETIAADQGFVNIYSSFTKRRIWPRGLPLDRIHVPALPATIQDASVGIWQGLADGDPDVDAIYRLVSNEPCYFDDRAPLTLSPGTLSPFNSQNTAVRPQLFPLLYLPAFVTFRFTDILRGWVAQPIMWAAGYRLGFLGATVVQERNPHDYTKDFESEVPCYLHANKVYDAVSKAVSPDSSVTENLRSSYSALHEIEIVTAAELDLLDAWLGDLGALTDVAPAHSFEV